MAEKLYEIQYLYTGEGCDDHQHLYVEYLTNKELNELKKELRDMEKNGEIYAWVISEIRENKIVKVD